MRPSVSETQCLSLIFHNISASYCCLTKQYLRINLFRTYYSCMAVSKCPTASSLPPFLLLESHNPLPLYLKKRVWLYQRGGCVSCMLPPLLVYGLFSSLQHWNQLDKVEGPSPVPRSNHAAACLWNGMGHPQLLISGGWDYDCDVVYGDTWIVDLQTGKWKEVGSDLKVFMLAGLKSCHTWQVHIPGLQPRYRHSATAFCICPGVMEVTLFGGYPKWLGDPLGTTVLRFGEFAVKSIMARELRSMLRKAGKIKICCVHSSNEQSNKLLL